MLMGSISPGPRYNIDILFYFIISHVTLLICVQTSTKHSVLTSTTTMTTNMATMVQQQHHHHHHHHHHSPTTTTRVGAELNMRKVPRRRVLRRLGPRRVIFSFYVFFSVLIDMYRYFWCIKRHRDVCRRQWQWQWAQKTRLASFGP